jgi:hypothetical protein
MTVKARNAFERIMWAAQDNKGIRLSAHEVAWMSTFPGLQEMARIQDMPSEDEADHSCFAERGSVDTFRCGGDGWHRCVECAYFDGGLKSAGTETP